MTPKQEKFFEKVTKKLAYSSIIRLYRGPSSPELKMFWNPDDFQNEIQYYVTTPIERLINRYWPRFDNGNKKTPLKLKYTEKIIIWLRSEDRLKPFNIELTKEYNKAGGSVCSAQVMCCSGSALPELVMEQINLIGAEEVFNHLMTKLNVGETQ